MLDISLAGIRSGQVSLHRSQPETGKGAIHLSGYFDGNVSIESQDANELPLSQEAAMIKLNMADRKIIDDVHHITQKRGNGQLRREIWVDEQGTVTRYNLAYINHALHGDDNGRVVGYDNQHGYHHRHYFGLVAPVSFTSFQNIEDQFQADWTALRSEA